MLRNRVDLRDALKAMLPTSGADKDKAAKLERFKELRNWARPELKFLQVEQKAPAEAAQALAASVEKKSEVKTDG
jgi:hypothetical protein